LVKVTSNARRVVLTWRTPANQTKSATLTIRAGKSQRWLPAQSTAIFARAQATTTLRASLKVAVQPAANPAPTPPAPVSSLTASQVTASTITLTWANPADTGVTAVIVRRATGAIAPATPTEGTAVPPDPAAANSLASSATDRGLSAGSRYSYAVFTADAAGTVSPAATLTATTAAAEATATCSETVTLGTSRSGAPIQACRLRGSVDAAKRTLLVVGSMHGNEQAGIGIATRMRTLDVTGKSANIWVIDTINPDGTAANTRSNAAGVDLNRNFPTSGEATAATQPEARALMAALPRIQPSEVVVFHQHMNLIDCAPFRPLTLTVALRDLTGYRAPLPSRCLPEYVGTFTGWADRTYDWTSAVTFELEAAPPATKLDRLAAAMVSLAVR
jgi:protein MpaA